MAESSLRASRPVRRGGLSNALFLVAAAELPPTELSGIAEELTINFPWGSLLRGTLGLDHAAAAGIAGLMKPGGCSHSLVSISDRDGLGLAPLTDEDRGSLAERWSSHGLDLMCFRPATTTEIEATGSTWAKRLGAGSAGGAGGAGAGRLAWRLDLRRNGRAADDD
jgi:16S rRNA (adenine(1408)-N(1))-methyltransferase